MHYKLLECLLDSTEQYIMRCIFHFTCTIYTLGVESSPPSVRISLNKFQYCFVNQTTIRVSDNFTSELQDIVNKTEHVILSTTINSMVIFNAPSNGSRCSSDANDCSPNNIYNSDGDIFLYFTGSSW